MASEIIRHNTEMPNSGLYIIEISLHAQAEITVGSLGMLQFSPGSYYYIGSAQKNLKQRVERHLRQEKKCRWHIDYLTVTSLKKKALLLPSQKEECALAQSMKKHFSFKEINRFGCSDCSCKSHLLFSEQKRELNALAKQIYGKGVYFVLL